MVAFKTTGLHADAPLPLVVTVRVAVDVTVPPPAAGLAVQLRE